MRIRGGILALCLAAGVGVGACNRGPDPSDAASKALKNANLNDVKVDWDRDAHVAHLKGTVDRPVDRERAEQITKGAVGTSGRVLNEVTIKDVNDKSADDLDGRIRTDLKKMMNDDPTLRDRDINFDVNNGAVTVKGEVRTASEKARVSEMVRATPGVRDMANSLEIKPQK